VKIFFPLYLVPLLYLQLQMQETKLHKNASKASPDMKNAPITLSDIEKIRYSRHLMLPGFGPYAQSLLKRSSVLVVGAGGLGAPTLIYLAAAGVGKITVIDADTIALSNLQRQVLFKTQDLGQSKSKISSQKLADLNPEVEVVAIAERFTVTNAMNLIKAHDLVIDCTDNFATRYLINDACVLCSKPFIYGSIYRFEGQLSVFNFCKDGELGPNYRDLFPTPPGADLVTNCADGGVLGVLPGIIGSMQALEAIKLLADIGEVLSGKLLLYDALSASSRIVNIAKEPTNPISGNRPIITELIDYESFCNLSEEKADEITATQLKQWVDEGKDFQIVDVREPYEYTAGNIGGESIPLSQFTELPDNPTIIVVCRSGVRSRAAISQFAQMGEFVGVYHLRGGLLSWQEDIDPKLQVI
jgi:molybdopterin/thiamine biosynthesis adenylyltransferase/rhodanese-related sulfurtransferase